MPKAKKSEATKSEKIKDPSKPKTAKSPKGKAAPTATKAPKPAPVKAEKKVKSKSAPLATSVPKLAPKARAKSTKVTKVTSVTITTEDIALRAYFIAERRNAMGWPGDSDTDWLEAEAQLRAEQSEA